MKKNSRRQQLSAGEGLAPVPPTFDPDLAPLLPLDYVESINAAMADSQLVLVATVSDTALQRLQEHQPTILRVNTGLVVLMPLTPALVEVIRQRKAASH